MSEKKTICSHCLLTARCRIYKSGERAEAECPIDCYVTERDALFPMDDGKQEAEENHG